VYSLFTMLKKSALIRDYPGRFQAEAQCFKDGGAKLLLNGAITSPTDHSACASKALKKREPNVYVKRKAAYTFLHVEEVELFLVDAFAGG
jgi:hypothetical protein